MGLMSGLSDSDLLKELKISVSKERALTTEVLEFLREVDRRRLYAESGYSSLWEFCVKELGYTEGSASRRISSMVGARARRIVSSICISMIATRAALRRCD